MNATAGYRSAQETIAIFPDLGRTVVEVVGSRAVRVVNGLTSNAIDGLSGGSGVYSFLLNRKGRVVVDLRVLAPPGFDAPADPASDRTKQDERLWLDLPTAGLEALEAHLGKYVPPIFATHRRLEFDVVSVLGPEAADWLTRAASGATLDFHRGPGDLAPLGTTTIDARNSAESGLLVRREDIEGPGFDLYLPTDRAPTVVADLLAAAEAVDGAKGTPDDWQSLRIERGLPVYGSELGPGRLAQEAGQDARAISFEKGCFTGQEVVARIHYRGHVNRHLRGFRLMEGPGGAAVGNGSEEDGSHPQAGAALTLDGKSVGTLTSITTSPRFGRIALGYVRREIEPGAFVTSAAFPGQLKVSDLPFT